MPAPQPGRRTRYETRQSDQGRRVRSIRMSDAAWELLSQGARDRKIPPGDLMAAALKKYLGID